MKPKKKTEPPAAGGGEPLSFEQALARLEQIVADMEAADLPLDDVLQRYEEGTKLVRFCGHKLEEAEKKIELLAKKSDGTVTLQPFGEERREPTADEDDAEAPPEAKLF